MMKIVSIFYSKVADLYRDQSIGEKINIEVSKLILLYNMPVSKKVQQYNTILVEPSITAAYPTQQLFWSWGRHFNSLLFQPFKKGHSTNPS